LAGVNLGKRIRKLKVGNQPDSAKERNCKEGGIAILRGGRRTDVLEEERKLPYARERKKRNPGKTEIESSIERKCCSDTLKKKNKGGHSQGKR